MDSQVLYRICRKIHMWAIQDIATYDWDQFRMILINKCNLWLYLECATLSIDLYRIILYTGICL